MTNFKKYLLLIILAILLAAFFYFDGYRWLSFDALKTHREQLLVWRDAHYLFMLLGFMLIYTVSVAVSIPGAFLLTLAGGFLFGPVVGTLAVVFSATLGAVLLYFAVKIAFRDWFAQKSSGFIKKMEKGFQENAFSYLLSLRLIPLFPFWLVNIVPALIGVPLSTYTMATFIGIIPGSFVYVWVGSGLGQVFDTHADLSLSMMSDPKILLPLLGLALLSLVPVFYQRLKKKERMQ